MQSVWTASGDLPKDNEEAGVPAKDKIVGSMVKEVQVEATFPDGTKLVTVHHPIG